MEEKSSPRHSSLRSFFGFRSNNLTLFRRSAGFTLVELLVVIGILGILVAAILLTLSPIAQIQKGNDAKRKADLSQIQKALETYYQDNGRYPAHSASPPYRIVKLDGEVADWGASFSPYMTTLPKDPKGSYLYVYYASSNGQSYWLYGSLERGTITQFCNAGNPCVSLTSNGINSNACGGVCNFGASSSNVSP